MSWGAFALGFLAGGVVVAVVLLHWTRRCTCFPPDVSVED